VVENGQTLQGGYTVGRAVTVGILGGTVSNVEIDHLQVTSIGRVWVHNSIGQALFKPERTCNLLFGISNSTTSQLPPSA